MMILYLASILFMFINSVISFVSDEFGTISVDNYTPHIINLYSPNGKNQICGISSSGIARSKEFHETVDTLSTDGCSVPVDRVSYGEVEGLPPEKEGVYHIVSMITALQCAGKRNDLLIVSGTVRDDQGRIIGCTGFAVYNQ